MQPDSTKPNNEKFHCYGNMKHFSTFLEAKERERERERERKRVRERVSNSDYLISLSLSPPLSFSPPLSLFFSLSHFYSFKLFFPFLLLIQSSSFPVSLCVLSFSISLFLKLMLS